MVRLASGDAPAALADAAEADRLLREMTSTQVGAALIGLVHARALWEVGRRDEAHAAASEAAARVRDVAARLSDARRPLFLAIEEHQTLFALERAWASEGS